MRITKFITVLLLLIFGILTLIHPPFPHDMYLQHIGTVLLLIILSIDIKRNFLQLSSFLGIALLTGLHILAARWVYSYVPYNEWIKVLFDFDLNEYFGFERNHFDRFVHFAFGILVWPFLMQVLGNWKTLTRLQTIFMAWLFIQTAGMVYEIFEWTLTIILSTEAADNFNGQQGDWWDAQKDMALSFLSSTLMGFIYLLKKKKRDDDDH